MSNPVSAEDVMKWAMGDEAYRDQTSEVFKSYAKALGDIEKMQEYNISSDMASFLTNDKVLLKIKALWFTICDSPCLKSPFLYNGIFV